MSEACTRSLKLPLANLGFAPQLVESDRRRIGDVEALHVAAHGDRRGNIAALAYQSPQTHAFRAEHDCRVAGRGSLAQIGIPIGGECDPPNPNPPTPPNPPQNLPTAP